MKTTLFLSFLALTTAFASASEPQTLQNPGFEGVGQSIKDTATFQSGTAKISGTVAPEWEDNSSWADVDIRYWLDPLNPHGGKTAQKVEVTRVGNGAAQFVQSVSFVKRRINRFSVWLRGLPGQSVQISLRKASAPYNDFAVTTANLNAEWRQFQVYGQISEDAAGYLMIRAAAPMTYWADDAEFVDLTDAKASGPPKTGNLLGGGSFEAGLPFGWSGTALQYGTAFTDNGDGTLRGWRPQTDDSQFLVGKRSLRLDIPASSAADVFLPAISTNFGRPHTLSFWAKASRPAMSGQTELAFNTDLKNQFIVGTQWQRITWTFTMPLLPITRFKFYIPGNGQGGTIWLDGVQLEEKAVASPDYVAAAPHEMTLHMARLGHIVFDGEKAVASLQIAPTPPQNAKIRLDYRNLSGKMRPWKTVLASAKTLDLPQFGGRRGLWKLRAQLVGDKNQPLSLPIEMVWSRLPRPRAVEAKKSFFGLHVPMTADYLGLAYATGHKWNRLHDLSMIGKWPVAEPEKGRWNYYDAEVDLAKKAGISILGMLDGAPKWQTTQSRGPTAWYWGIWNIPDAPGALDGWKTYVGNVTGHYKGRIDDWEVWNEPWGNWFLSSGNPNATPDLYAKLLKIARDEAKKRNPNANIVGIDTFPGSDAAWTQPVLKIAGKNACDVFSFHDYNDSLYGSSQPRAISMVSHFAALQKPFDTPKPQWQTEGGPVEMGSLYASKTGGLAPELQPAYIVRWDVSHLAAGTRKSFLYAVRSNVGMGDVTYQATEYDGAIKPILAARAVLAFLVDGAGRPTQKSLESGLDCTVFPPQNGQHVSVLWSYDSKTHRVKLPKGTRALDVWGNPISGENIPVSIEPVYFLGKMLPALAPVAKVPPQKAVQLTPMPLKNTFHGKFLIGTALSEAVLLGQDSLTESLARTHFDAFTPENSLKPEAVQPRRGEFHFELADALVEMAKKSGATAIGHTLVWHSQTPDWFFKNAQGEPLSREVALENMREHIAAVVGRYKGRIKEWDVVNEAISDRDDEFLRPTPWLSAIGEDYIAQAFRAAHEADPDAVLVYNDYGNESGAKRDKTLRLLKSLLADGVPIHAVGMQCHWRLGRVPVAETEKAIELYAALGLKVMVTELDIGVLSANYDGADIAAVEAENAATNIYAAGLPEDVGQRLSDAYAQSFEVFLRHQDALKRVTLWGVHDGGSWLNNFPMRGRTDYPLIFDREGKPKAAFFAVQKLAAQKTP